MKINVDEAIEILKDYIELDREIREGDTESDYSRFCEEKCLSIESLIEYVFASRCAFKTKNKINSNNKQITDEEIKQLIVCLDNATYKEDNLLVTEKKRCKLIEYNYNLQHKLYESLGIRYNELVHTIDIDNLEIKDNH